MKTIQRITRKSVKNFKVIPENKIVVGEMLTNGLSDEFADICTENELDCVPEFIWGEGYIDEINIKAIAKCDPKDAWNEKVGIDVASAKLDMKEHKRRVRKCERLLKVLNSLTKKTEEICYKHRAKATAIEEDLKNYYGGDI